MKKFGIIALAAFLSGCGGGGGGSETLSTNIAPNSSVLLNFGNQQSGTLNLQMEGTTVTGNLRVNAPAARQSTHAGHDHTTPFKSSIPANSYALTGRLAAPRDFSVSGQFPAPLGAFTVKGRLPTATATGTYSVVCGTQEASGIIPLQTAP